MNNEQGEKQRTLKAEAHKLVIGSRNASTNALQRKLQLPYSTAAALIEELAADGVVSSPNANGKRRVRPALLRWVLRLSKRTAANAHARSVPKTAAEYPAPSSGAIGLVEEINLELFGSLEKELLRRHPEVLEDSLQLQQAIVPPTCRDPDAFWKIIWEKPLYANTRVANASKQIAALAPLLQPGWRTIGTPGSDYHVSKIGKGSSTESFQINGARAARIRSEYNIAPHRMFAIQGAAAALQRRAELPNKGVYADLAHLELGEMVRDLLSEMGQHWGPITVLHLLTDMGLACKPDLHLVRTVRQLGFFQKIAGVPSFSEAVAVNQFVKNLTVAAFGEASPNRLRHVDLVLMEISRKGLLRQAKG